MSDRERLLYAQLENCFGKNTIIRLHDLVDKSLLGILNTDEARGMGHEAVKIGLQANDLEAESQEGRDLALLIGALLDHATDLVRWHSDGYQGGAP